VPAFTPSIQQFSCVRLVMLLTHAIATDLEWGLFCSTHEIVPNVQGNHMGHRASVQSAPVSPAASTSASSGAANSPVIAWAANRQALQASTSSALLALTADREGI
jgi:hypothetical protein